MIKDVLATTACLCLPLPYVTFAVITFSYRFGPVISCSLQYSASLPANNSNTVSRFRVEEVHYYAWIIHNKRLLSLFWWPADWKAGIKRTKFTSGDGPPMCRMGFPRWERCPNQDKIARRPRHKQALILIMPLKPRSCHALKKCELNFIWRQSLWCPRSIHIWGCKQV